MRALSRPQSLLPTPIPDGIRHKYEMFFDTIADIGGLNLPNDEIFELTIAANGSVEMAGLHLIVMLRPLLGAKCTTHRHQTKCVVKFHKMKDHIRLHRNLLSSFFVSAKRSSVNPVRNSPPQRPAGRKRG